MKTAIMYGLLALNLFWGCTSDGESEDLTSGEPSFTFQIKGGGTNKTMSGKNIVFNSTTIDAQDIEGDPTEINSVAIIAQVPKGEVVEEVLISITKRTYVDSGVHSIGTDILENYNAFVSYSEDNTAGISFQAADGSVNLKTRSESVISGSLNVSGGGVSITGNFTAPNLN